MAHDQTNFEYCIALYGIIYSTIHVKGMNAKSNLQQSDIKMEQQIQFVC